MVINSFCFVVKYAWKFLQVYLQVIASKWVWCKVTQDKAEDIRCAWETTTNQLSYSLPTNVESLIQIFVYPRHSSLQIVLRSTFILNSTEALNS